MKTDKTVRFVDKKNKDNKDNNILQKRKKTVVITGKMQLYKQTQYRLNK